VPFTVGPSVDSQHVCALLTNVAKANADVVEFVSCAVTDVKPDAITMALTVWAPDSAAARQAESELLDAIRITLARSDLSVGGDSVPSAGSAAHT
jgi:hypothetical protein